jgi:hypothetical protein
VSKAQATRAVLFATATTVRLKPRLAASPFNHWERRLSCFATRNMTDRAPWIAVAASLDTQNAKTVFPVVERHALDEARQYFLGREFRLRFEKVTDPDA